jgi:hypothetical protein
MSTALVPIAVSEPSWCAGPGVEHGRPRADFLAHLIATAVHAPQTRARRRAEPAEAVAVYGAIGRQPDLRRSTTSRTL